MRYYKEIKLFSTGHAKQSKGESPETIASRLQNLCQKKDLYIDKYMEKS